MEATMRPAETAGEDATVKAPDVTAAAQGPVQERLVELRRLSDSDPAAARAATWEWFRDAGRRVGSERDAAITELDELFKSGEPSEGIEGETEGMLVTFTMHPLFDRGVAGLARAWMPWAGKRFDATASRGDNLLARNARLPVKAIWPRYTPRARGEDLSAFEFITRIEPGAVDPETRVLVIDYAPVASNPRLLIKSIRDELVEVVPGAHLGKMLWRRGPYPGERHHLLAFFALKTPLG